MDNPNNFINMFEYNIAMYALGFLFISECVIWIYTSKGHHNRIRKSSDSGTVWLIIIGWCCSIMSGAYFRSDSVPEEIRNWLLPHFVYYIGITFILIGVIIRCTSVWKLKRAFTLSVQTTNDQHLIQNGLYSIVRNPAYTGSIISLLGVSLVYRHALGVVSVLLICFICYGIRIRIEEKALLEQFKNEFQEYCIHTKYRLIPKIY